MLFFGFLNFSALYNLGNKTLYKFGLSNKLLIGIKSESL